MMTIPTRLFAPAALLCAMAAQANPVEIVLHNVDLHPATQIAARHTVRRIDAAALEACGAPEGSLHQIQSATRKGECWREAAGNAVRQAGDPMLAEAFARFAPVTR
jgi:UrcA family protein